MRIIGIDPGIERTGFALLEKEKGSVRLLDCGRIFTSKEQDFPHRLASIAQDLEEVLDRWKPEAAALEQVFFSKNVKTAMKVSGARGVILQTLAKHRVETQELNPSSVKMAVTGDGRADKKQMLKMIREFFHITLQSDDTADAIACGLCCLLQSHETSR